jgi:hypothetical protein
MLTHLIKIPEDDEEQYSSRSPESDGFSGSMNIPQTCASSDDITLPLYSPLTSEKSTYIKDSHGRPRQTAKIYFNGLQLIREQDILATHPRGPSVNGQ